MASYEVVTQGGPETRRRLLAYGQRLGDFTRFWPLVVEAFTRRNLIWYEREGEGWEPLSEPYARWKAVAFPGKPILVRTGDLRRSLTEADQALLAATPRELFLGTDVEYASWHLHGTDSMPARRPLIPALRLAGAVARLVQAHVLYPPGLR
jgi:phage gpG-like protein